MCTTEIRSPVFGDRKSGIPAAVLIPTSGTVRVRFVREVLMVKEYMSLTCTYLRVENAARKFDVVSAVMGE